MFPNTHEALISREDFQKVQDILQAAEESSFVILNTQPQKVGDIVRPLRQFGRMRAVNIEVLPSQRLRRVPVGIVYQFT